MASLFVEKNNRAKAQLAATSKVTHSAPGDPQKDIGDILENDNDLQNMKVLRNLNHLRKLLFAYRLLHCHEPIPDIQIKGIRGRDKEVIKPLLRLFKKHGEETSLEAVKNALYYFVRERNRAVIEDFNAAMHGLVKDLIVESGGNNYELHSSEIWAAIKDRLRGVDVEGKPSTVRTELYGEISTKKLAAVLHGLGGKPGHNTKKDHRVWTFDEKTLDRFNAVYQQIPDQIEIEDIGQQTTLLGDDEAEEIEENLLFTDGTDTLDTSWRR